MINEHNFDELAKEVKREISLKMKEELPDLFNDIDMNNKAALGTIIADAVKLSMTFSMKYTDTLVKRVLEESNQTSNKELK
ncbi:hypothetical protein [Psychrobacillus vulpis]|uniref:Uncharacterized protein n=1 Tax=Psychrobacillus vulpis TaxID=2325572 RepID=A0A544TWK2_9BACI|nr:hypothetical protein [Psychrobacillus vulpis]TQR21828.1 hypothetical protein FG384_02475 [Psychrobacillus vulpis]